MSDETLRRRIAAIASADDGGLSEAARERILRHVATEGPRIYRQARRLRLALYAAGPALALAAGFAFFSMRGAEAKSRSIAEVSTVAAVRPTMACATRTAPTGAAFVSSEVSSTLDLGAVALAVADVDAVVLASVVEPCRTIIGLDSGRVTVHAKDLGGGELSVRARDGVVTVHGTVFAVTQSNDSLVVEVAEGTVGVTDRTGEHVLHGGERLYVSAMGVAQGALDAARDRALRGTVGVPAVVGLDTLPSAETAQAEPSTEKGAPARGTVVAPPRSALLAAREKALDAPTAVLPKVSAEAVAPPAAAELPPKAAEPAKAATSADLLTQAEQARRAGKFPEARTLYRRIADGTDATAEAAWVALARMELSLGHPAAARDATKRRQERFGHGTLEPEALWIDVRTYRQTGDVPRARALAEELVRRWPASPQARAAQQWISAGD
jgi:hypothetical protein